MKEREYTKCGGEALPESNYAKCCGNCLCSSETEYQGFLCTKHKIQTEYANLCYAWEAKAEA